MDNIQDIPKRGRPSKFNDSIRDKIIQLVTEGKTDEQVADIIGVAKQTLANWRLQYPDFLVAVKEAKHVADELVEASLYQRAIGYDHKETKVFCYEGSIITKEIIKHIPPDITAQIFWLKNRQPENWRDVQDHNLDVRPALSELLKAVEEAKKNGK